MHRHDVLRRSILFLMLVLLVLVSVFFCVDHYRCADSDCMICNILRPLFKNQLSALTLCVWMAVGAGFLLLRMAPLACVLFCPTPICNKVKLSC